MADSLSSKMEAWLRQLDANFPDTEYPVSEIRNRLTPLLELAKEMERAVARAKPNNYGDPLVKIAQDLRGGASE